MLLLCTVRAGVNPPMARRISAPVITANICRSVAAPGGDSAGWRGDTQRDCLFVTQRRTTRRVFRASDRKCRTLLAVPYKVPTVALYRIFDKGNGCEILINVQAYLVPTVSTLFPHNDTACLST